MDRHLTFTPEETQIYQSFMFMTHWNVYKVQRWFEYHKMTFGINFFVKGGRSQLVYSGIWSDYWNKIVDSGMLDKQKSILFIGPIFDYARNSVAHDAQLLALDTMVFKEVGMWATTTKAQTEVEPQHWYDPRLCNYHILISQHLPSR